MKPVELLDSKCSDLSVDCHRESVIVRMYISCTVWKLTVFQKKVPFFEMLKWNA